MQIALFLHFYQPPTQFAKVLKSITNSSYRRLLNIIRKYPSAKLTLNVSASLTEQLVSQGFEGVVGEIRELVLEGRVELVGSAAYHPLLTEISADEIRRQIALNDEINRKYFGEVYQPKGFFPPEMAVNQKVLAVVAEMGFKWVIVDESAVAGARRESGDGKLKLRASSLQLLTRNTDLSVKIAFSQIRTVRELISERPFDSPRSLKVASNDFVVLAMDGETFGHHRPEQLEFLEELFSSPEIKLVTLSELPAPYPSPPEVTIKPSSWGPWERWKNPRNPIHRLQWELTELAIDSVRSSKHQITSTNNQTITKSKIQNSKRFDIGYLNLFGDCDFGFEVSDHGKKHWSSDQRKWLKARELLDRALHSDQFWWASATPCWHYQMIKRGAKMLLDVVLTVPDAADSERKRAGELYARILSTGLKLYGDRVVE